MRAAPKAIQDFVFKWEGHMSDDAGDPGGFTVWGICRRFLDDYQRRRGDFLRSLGLNPPLSRAAHAALNRDQAAAIMWDEFGKGLDGLPLPCFFAAYDASVNCGNARGRKWLQQAAREFAPGLAVDGIIGPKSCAACRIEPLAIAQKAIDRREAFYNELARQPRFKKNLRGWLNRTTDLRALCRVVS